MTKSNINTKSNCAATGNQSEKWTKDQLLAHAAKIPEFTVDETGEITLRIGGDADISKTSLALMAILGVKSDAAVTAILKQLILYGGQSDVMEEKINSMLAMVADMQPGDDVETMLITQMVTTQDLAMKCATNASLKNQTFEGKELNFNTFTKLTRAFVAQVEALNKYRNKGKQQVVVKHVTVNEGGKAIVGDVDNSRGRGGDE